MYSFNSRIALVCGGMSCCISVARVGSNYCFSRAVKWWLVKVSTFACLCPSSTPILRKREIWSKSPFAAALNTPLYSNMTGWTPLGFLNMLIDKSKEKNVQRGIWKEIEDRVGYFPSNYKASINLIHLFFLFSSCFLL